MSLQPLASFMDEQLQLLHLDCRWSFCTLFNLEADEVTFLQAFETGALDCTVMNKDIFPTILNRDKSKTLLIIEPLYRTLCHFFEFLLCCVCRRVPPY